MYELPVEWFNPSWVIAGFSLVCVVAAAVAGFVLDWGRPSDD